MSKKLMRQGFIIPFLILVSLILVFQIVNVQDPRIKEVFNTNLLMLGTLGSIAGLFAIRNDKKTISQWFPITEKHEFLQYLAVGVLFGVLTFIVVMIGNLGTDFIHNLFGSIDLGKMVIDSSQTVFIVGLLQPFTETLVTVVAFIFIRNSLYSLKIPWAPVIAVVLVILAFSAWHFNAAREEAMNSGKEFPYEYGVMGLLGFATQTDLKQPSGFPQLLMAVIWIGLAVLLYENWAIAFAAHSFYNSITLMIAGITVGFAQTFTYAIVASWIIILFFVWQKFKGLKKLNDYSLKRLRVVS